jgi:hypothetical protein
VTIERIKLRTAIVAGFAFVAALASTPARAQDRPDFDHLAAHTAAAIDKAARGSAVNTAVLVFVFDEKPGPPSQLGIELSKEFEAALRNHAGKFHVADLDDLKELVASRNLPQNVLSDSLALKCSKSDLGLSAFVEGFIDYGLKGPVVKVVVVQLPSRRKIFHESQIFMISDSMHQLMSQRAPSLPPFEEKKVWVNPDHPPVPDAEAKTVKPSDDPRRMVQCLSCPPPSYSDEAVGVKVQGTVILMVQILADGFPSKITLTKGLSCDLTDQAFKTVERWRFKPATDVNGAPIAVIAPVEVTFRLY